MNAIYISYINQQYFLVCLLSRFLRVCMFGVIDK